MHAPARELAVTLIGAALGELFGPLSLPTDEDFADRQRVDAASVAMGNERAAALLTSAGLAGADFTEDDAVGLQSVLAAAVAVVERYELAAGWHCFYDETPQKKSLFHRRNTQSNSQFPLLTSKSVVALIATIGMKLGFLGDIGNIYVTNDALLRLKTGCAGRWRRVLTAILTLVAALWRHKSMRYTRLCFQLQFAMPPRKRTSAPAALDATPQALPVPKSAASVEVIELPPDAHGLPAMASIAVFTSGSHRVLDA
jgi:hypothetical protein